MAKETAEIDFNKIAALAAQGVLEGMARRLSGPLATQFAKFRHAASPKLGEYITDTLERLSTIRTILHSDEDTLIDNVYVAPTFVSGGARRSESEVYKTIRGRGRALISGSAGGGKSVFVKRLTCVLLQEYVDILPIYFELRDLNDDYAGDLLDSIHKQVCKKIPSFRKDIFTSEVATGHILLVLDGYDEVNHDVRDKLNKDISRICTDYNNARIVLTTRPEEGLESLQPFRVFRVLPMTKTQCISLLSKLDYDVSRKRSFIARVKAKLYDQHKDFLSNPLLASMMLMTFSEAGEIPSKMSNFYKQAFEVLFYKHDRSKGVYKRKSYSDLAIDDFERVFAFFCAYTYADEKFSFGDVEIRRYLAKSLNYEGVDVRTDSVLEDLLKSVCLIQREGLHYSFVHRSFQEYFAAVFISRQSYRNAKIALDNILQRAWSDGVIKLCFQINRDLVETAWALQWLDKLTAALGRGETAVTLKQHYALLWSKVMLSPRGIEGFLWDEVPLEGQAFSAIEGLYPDIAGKIAVQYAENRDNSDANRSDTFYSHLASDNGLRRAMLVYFTEKELNQKYQGHPSNLKTVAISDVEDVVFDRSGLEEWRSVQTRTVNAIHELVMSRVSVKSSSFTSIFDSNEPDG